MMKQSTHREQEANRHMLAGLLAQRRLGFFNRMAARAEWQLGLWNAYWATLSRRGRRAFWRKAAPVAVGASMLGATLALALAYAPVSAASITVVDGEVMIDPNGLCSLVEAIQNANGTGSHVDCAAGTAGTDTVILPPGGDFLTTSSYYNINGRSAIPAITSGVVIEGNGSAIRRDPYYSSPARLFMVYDDADLTLNQVTLSGGRVLGAAGGAIYAVDQPPFTGYHNRSLTITNSTIVGNYAEYWGGAITFRGSRYGSATLTIENTTISGNSTAGAGGGLYIASYNSPLTATITDSTIADNASSGLHASIYDFVSPYEPVAITISRSVISGNTLGEASILLYSPGVSLATDHNVFGHDGMPTADAAYGFSPSATDITATSDGTLPTPLAAILSPLADNGGPTMTHALPPGSPAIDLAPTGPAADQRGLPRPSGAGFDAGAYEAQPPDDDDDGVLDATEDGAPNGGDGNNDGIPDSEQANVASLPDSKAGDYVTLAVPAGAELVDVTAVGNPSPGDAPAGVDFPIGFLDFSVRGLAPGGAVVATITLHGGQTINAYYKYGPTTGNPVDHWYPFLYDGATGAEFPGGPILLHLVDGGRGDADLTADGVIVDPGAPAAVESAMVFSGFFSPVDNAPVVNRAKGGSAVPVKFSLGDDFGLGIFAPGYPASQRIACDSSAPLDAIEQTVTAGQSGLQYDPATGQYTYVWKTQKSWGGTCRQLILRFSDGQERVALFSFK